MHKYKKDCDVDCTLTDENIFKRSKANEEEETHLFQYFLVILKISLYFLVPIAHFKVYAVTNKNNLTKNNIYV